MNQKKFGRVVLDLGENGQSKVSYFENGLRPTDDQIEKMNAFAQTHNLDWKFPIEAKAP